MWSETDFIKLEQDEREITDEAIIAMLFMLSGLKGDLVKELQVFYQKYGKDGVVTYAESRKWVSEKDHRRRLTALTLLVSGAFASAFSDLEKHFRKFLTDVIGKESTFFGVAIDVDKLLARTWGVDDLYWLERLEKNVDLWKATISSDIKRAILQRNNLNDILSQLDKRFESIDKVLKKLGVTESTAVGSLSRQAIFKELGISKYRFYTKADERTCGQCGSLHGHVFPISAYEVGVTASPIHCFCRCWEEPILE